MASYATGYILVSRRDFVSDDDFDATLSSQKSSALGLIHSDLRVHKVKVPPTKELVVLAALQNNPNIEFAELDSYAVAALTLNDPQVSGDYVLTKIGAASAWDTCNGSGITVAVVDASVQSTNPYLAANIVAGHNVYNGTSDTTDVTGHGTGVAGVIGAVGANSTMGAGVAYGCSIMPIKATDSLGNGTFSSAAAGIMYASDHGCKIVNISWSNLYKSSTVIQAAQPYRTANDGI